MNTAIAEHLPLQRDRFALPHNATYLNCAYLAPQLRAVTDAGMDAVKRNETPWQIGTDDWFRPAEELRAGVAGLMNGDADGIALVPAASYGIAVAAANVPFERGQNVVVLHEQFPSNVYAWRALARERGGEVRTARKAPEEAWTEAVIEATDEDTAVVAVPNCHWTDGALLDLARVGERARAMGAALVVDASQSLGAFPTDVNEVKPDFLVSVGYKWQLGPYGLSYLYAAPKWRERGRPLEASWLARAGAENFSALVDYTDEYRPGARRFDMGQFPQFVLMPMALAAVSQLLEWGVDRVQATLSGLTGAIAREAEAMGCSVLPADRRVGHMLGIRFEGDIPEGLSERLAEKRIYASVRGDSVRVAPHVYNGEDDVARFLGVLREFMPPSPPRQHTARGS